MRGLTSFQIEISVEQKQNNEKLWISHAGSGEPFIPSRGTSIP